MPTRIAEFTALGPPRTVAAAIEKHAAERRTVNALVVPWQSGSDVLTMAVTSMAGDGWAIEHTNLGTITLEARGDDRTLVAVSAEDPGRSDLDESGRDKLVGVLTAFARRIEQKLAMPTAAGPPR